jgi:Glycosyl transferases group 1
MRVLHWHVHGSWSTAFVNGRHTYLIPVTPSRDVDGLGRARTYRWPDNAIEVPLPRLREEHVDLVVLQRPHELHLAEALLHRQLGREVPAVYVEHNAPRDDVPNTQHPLAERDDIPIVHVTPFNELYWDCGRAPTTVIEHGIVDPGPRYTGEAARAGVVINEPIRRWRVTGTDLLPRFASEAPVDVFGMGVDGLGERLGLGPDRLRERPDLPQDRMHDELAKLRVYLHPIRWTSLGLSLIEAMHLGMPVVALAATEAIEAVPPEAGAVSTRVDVLAQALRELMEDPARARHAGSVARATALKRYSLERFHGDWDRLLRELAR